MKRLILILTLLLVGLKATISIAAIAPATSSGNFEKSFTYNSHSKAEDQKIFLCLLEEDNEDVDSSENKKDIPEKTVFSSFTFKSVVNETTLKSIVWSNDSTPAPDFLKLRVLRL